MRYKIYPPIGIARVGNSLTGFYVGPELFGHPGFDIDPGGGETPVTHYKVTETEVKRQAARFRIFEVPDGGDAPRPAQLPQGATIEWTVHLVNKKAAVQRTSGPPTQPKRPQLAPNSADRLIDPQPQTISGARASGVRFDKGEFLARRVPLGELRTDRAQNLLVLGGFGFSSSPTNAAISNFYNNPGWHDDVSDGPITARIRRADGTSIDAIEPGWVVVAPPDFAPDVQGVVTLYDIMLQVGTDHLGVAPPAQVSFTRDVFPLLNRTRRLKWVNADPNWSDINEEWATLADPSAGAAQLRKGQASVVRNVESVLSRYHLTSLQNVALDKWVAGDFSADWAGAPQPGNTVTAEGLTHAALEAAVGQGFFPGIEAGIMVTDRTLYSSPFDFRVDHAQMKPGDLTALMALPWQADFLDCEGGWWPSQRPDDVLPSTSVSQTLNWQRGADTYLRMVHNFAKLGFITAQRDAEGHVVFAEEQRAPSSQFL